MALTQIGTGGIKDDAITDAKLPANSVGNSEMKDDAIGTAEIADNAVTNDQMADDAVGVAELSATGTAGNTTYLRGDNTWTVPPDTNTTYSVGDGGLTQNNFTNTLKTKLDGIAASANNYTHPNHSGEVTSTADGAQVVADDVIDEANLKVDNTPTNDYVLTAKSSAAGGLTWAEAASGGAASFRNILINSNFSVSQRYKTSSHSSDGYVIDRWYNQLSGGSGSHQQLAFSGGDEIEGSNHYLKMNVTTGDNWCSLRYRVENVRRLTPGSWTISFWAKGTTPSGGLKFWGNQTFGSGGSADVDISETSLTALTGSWTRQSLTFTVGSLSSKTINDNNSYFNFNIGQGSDSGTAAWNIEIANVQLEKGAAMTDYEQKGDETYACQRYYQQLAYDIYDPLCSGAAFAGDMVHGTVHFYRPFRTEPSMSKAGGTNWLIFRYSGNNSDTNNSIDGDDFNLQQVSETMANIRFTGFGFGNNNMMGAGGVLYTQSSSARLGFDAEL